MPFAIRWGDIEKDRSIEDIAPAIAKKRARGCLGSEWLETGSFETHKLGVNKCQNYHLLSDIVARRNCIYEIAWSKELPVSLTT